MNKIEAKKADAEEAIRAYLTASDAEREPVAASDVRELVERLEKVAGRVRINNGSFSDIAHEAATALTDLEAENARLKAEVERLRELASELPIVKYALRATEARLAEALKALDDLADLSAPGWSSDTRLQLQQAVQIANQAREKAALTARRVREGGKVDG